MPTNDTTATNLGKRLHALREEKKLSQGDIEKRTGLIRCYISRVENGHTVPNLGTLEKFARGLEVPLHMIFYEGAGKPEPPPFIKGAPEENPFERKLRRLISAMDDRDRKIFLYTVQKMAKR